MKIKHVAAAGTLAAIISAAAIPAQASVGGLFGLSITTDGSLGFSAHVLSNNRQDRWVGAAGVHYYPWLARSNQQFGLSLGGGYAGEHWAATGGWDFLQNAPVVSGGYATNQ
jgi:hypothetical protein